MSDFAPFDKGKTLAKDEWGNDKHHRCIVRFFLPQQKNRIIMINKIELKIVFFIFSEFVSFKFVLFL